MSVSEEERERLHLMLDALLNSRATLERIDPLSLTECSIKYQLQRPRKELFNNASVFLRKAIGKKLFEQELFPLFNHNLEGYQIEPEVLFVLSEAILSFLPLFMREGRYEGYSNNQNIKNIIQDFIGIYMGDEPKFFSITPRRQGQHKRPYRLARLRLTALDWDKYLSVVGISAKERHNFISQSYKTDWDAIRKWSMPLHKKFGFTSRPPENLKWARDEFQDNPDHIYSLIAMDGNAYWLELSSAKSGKES